MMGDLLKFILNLIKNIFVKLKLNNYTTILFIYIYIHFCIFNN